MQKRNLSDGAREDDRWCVVTWRHFICKLVICLATAFHMEGFDVVSIARLPYAQMDFFGRFGHKHSGKRQR